MNFLVADDDPISRTIIVRLLQKWGHSVTQVGSGQEALHELMKSNAPHIAILDWIMPDGDGVEVCRQVRSAELDFPPYLIVLTGLKDRAHRLAALKSGADDYLTKPLDPEEFEARIGTAARIIKLQSRLILEARTDPLTGLSNRKGILARLEQEIERADRNDEPLSVGMMDIDHFKQVNDTWGHPTGDDVLVDFSLRLRRALRTYDSCGRYGGEEFLAILPGSPADETPWERIRLSIENPVFATRSGDLAVRASFGAVLLRQGENAAQVLARADAALYEAKRNGRNRVVFVP